MLFRSLPSRRRPASPAPRPSASRAAAFYSVPLPRRLGGARRWTLAAGLLILFLPRRCRAPRPLHPGRTGTGDTVSRRSSSRMTAVGGGSRVKGTPGPGTRCEEATGRDARAGRRPPLVCLGESSLFWMGCNGQMTKAADVTTTCLYKCLRRTAQGRTTCMFEREGCKRGGWSKRRRGRNGTT